MLFVVTGPPASGKSTWVKGHAQPGDITIDFDALARTLTPHDDTNTHDHPVHVNVVTRAARQAAIDAALPLSGTVDVYVIHSAPGADTMATYHRYNAEIITVDPGMDVVLARAKAERPAAMQGAVKQWYRTDTAQRDEASKIRSSHAWRVLAQEFKDVCRTKVNDDGTLGAPCHICHQAIDYEAGGRKDPHAFEADHYQPLATHPHLAFMRSNLRPSHAACNRSRGAKAAPAQGEWVEASWS